MLPATDADLVEFYGIRPPVTVRAMAGRVGGEVFGIVGLARFTDTLVFFSDYKPEMKWCLAKRSTLRGILTVRDWIRASKLPVIAVADKNEADSDRLMQKFGFTQVDTCEVGGVYKWLS